MLNKSQPVKLLQLSAMGLLDKILPKELSDATRSDVGKTTIQLIDTIYDFINWFAYFVGIEVRRDWKFNVRSKVNMILNIFFAWTEIYTFWLVVPSIDCVILLTGLCFTVTVMIKFASVVLNHERFLSLVNVIYKMASKNTEGRRHLIIADAKKTIFHHFKHIIIGVYFGGVVYLFYPIYDYVVNRTLTPVSPLIFPFLDDDTIRSFLISTMLNVTAALVNSFGTVAVSMFFVTFVEAYGTLNTLIEDDFRTFDGMWKRGNKNIAERRAAFRNIITAIMHSARFNLSINELYSLITTVQIGCCFFTMSTLIFGYLALDYVGGLGACVYFLTELMLFCYIGQLMDNQAERIASIIFHSDWYVYDVSCQKDILFALCVVKKLKSINVAGIMPLNFATGVQVIKNIYSITMFLLNALE
ncbi:uncharacterized protein LOC119074852 [Bradysia coprophila]|uniref:uncharacterized protein LOC119074852 n=1 Tax=Bradysia coprophila TaxID=38358 RepID=UPI00187DBDD3|nr:uncharacterized protein LOC119074852 [Bradysia coprophila]